MEFEKRKSATLNSLANSKTDKSPKGTLDTPIIPLLNVINSHPSYYTTSSCSGRISILSQPKKPSLNPATPTNKKKARGGSWLFISHDPANHDLVLRLLFPSESPTELVNELDESGTELAESENELAESGTALAESGNELDESGTESSELVFRFEPLIIAIECRDIESAQFMVSLAIKCGFRESGITSANKKRVIVGIRCSIRMEVPLGDSDRIMVSKEYVRFIVGLANKKLEANWNRTRGFLSALIENGFVGPAISENGDDHDHGGGDQLELERTNGDTHIGN